MKVFWWQGGLHAEPETPEEGRAMQLLFENCKRSSIAADGEAGAKAAKGQSFLTSSALQQLSESNVANEQFIPIGVFSNLLDK